MPDARLWRIPHPHPARAMIGGTVIETIVTDDRVWLNCKDNHYRSTLGIYVERTDAARSISEGDQIWWQGFYAFWTPKSRAFSDHRLRRIGCSGVPRPTLILGPEWPFGDESQSFPAASTPGGAHA
jgi:hypothetical protein